MPPRPAQGTMSFTHGAISEIAFAGVTVTAENHAQNPESDGSLGTWTWNAPPPMASNDPHIPVNTPWFEERLRVNSRPPFCVRRDLAPR